MFSTKERKLERLRSGLNDTLSVQMYNAIIGLCILYGFIINAIIVGTCETLFASMNPIVFIVLYFISTIIGVFVTRSNNPVTSFIGYNFIVAPIGALLAICLPAYYIGDIMAAIVVTGIVVAIMTSLATMFPKFFAKLGVSLFVALLIGLITELIALLFGYAGGIFNWFFVILFSLYIGYDWHKSQMYPKTLDNAIDSAVDIYLDIINLFIRLLNLFSKSRD